MKQTLYKLSISISLSLLLASCGGGGGSTADNTLPTNATNKQQDINSSTVINAVKKPFKTTIADSPIPNHPLNKWNLADTSNIKFAKLDEDITDFSQIIYEGHPRLYFRDTDTEYLREKIKKNQKYWDQYIGGVVKNVFPDGMSVSEGAKTLAIPGNKNYAEMLLFLAYLEDDKNYKEMAIQWGLDMSDPSMMLEDNTRDIALRTRIENLSKIYDWFYNDMSLDQKQKLRTALKRNMDQLLTFGYMRDSLKENFIQSHSRWARGVIAEGNLALYGDFDANYTKEYADKNLNITRNKFLKYLDAERYIAIDGGWHLGYAYAYFNANYTFNYLTWTTATKETFLDDWMGELSYWFIYGLRGDKHFSLVGDSYSTNNLSIGILANAYNAKFKNDPYAQGYLATNEKTSGIWDSRMFILFLLKNDDLKAKSADTLPTSRLFKNAGTVIARDRWDEQTTHFYFKSSPFYNAGHHHRDENTFTLHYKVPLAINTGVYEGFDSDHYKNYYTRTFAHNTITVYNPDQKMYYNTDFNRNDSLASKLLINDGGQIYKKNDSIKKEDILPGAPNRLGGITNYQFNDGSYTYAVGDATKAYDPITVSLAKREIMYITDSGREHPTTIIVDRVEATDGNFKKRYILHVDTDKKPTIDFTNNIVEINSKGVDSNKQPTASRLTNMTLYPLLSELSLVGGKGDEFKSYGDPTANLNPTEEVDAILNNPYARLGNWRLEVSPTLGNKYDVLINILFVDDEGKPSITKEDALLIGDDTTDAIGVQFPNRVVVFPKSKEIVDSFSYKVVKDGKFRHTIATRYPEDTTVSYSINNKEVGTTKTGTGGCIDFTISAKTTDTISITKK